MGHRSNEVTTAPKVATVSPTGQWPKKTNLIAEPSAINLSVDLVPVPDINKHMSNVFIYHVERSIDIWSNENESHSEWDDSREFRAPRLLDQAVITTNNIGPDK